MEENLLDKIFIKARTYYAWQSKKPDIELLKKTFDLAILGPTSLNSQPLRIIFIESDAAKERLLKCLYPGNVEKTQTSPFVAIFAYDLNFYEDLPRLFPPMDAKSLFVGKEKETEEAAKLNSNLQIAYMIMAARAVGLDCGPMSGFNQKLCDEEFFAGTGLRSQVICNIGYGDGSKTHERLARYKFEEVCKIL